jgi:hypothetical protein
MTTIDLEVIRDLLPLYRSGLASPATRRLVEDHLAMDPELAGQLDPPDPTADDVHAAREFRAFARSRALLRWQRRLFGLAIGLSVLSLTTAMHVDKLGVSNVRLLAFEAPLVFAPIVIAAAGAWLGYFLLKRRVKSG